MTEDMELIHLGEMKYDHMLNYVTQEMISKFDDAKFRVYCCVTKASVRSHTAAITLSKWTAEGWKDIVTVTPELLKIEIPTGNGIEMTELHARTEGMFGPAYATMFKMAEHFIRD
jgi:hypothetical protein